MTIWQSQVEKDARPSKRGRARQASSRAFWAASWAECSSPVMRTQTEKSRRRLRLCRGAGAGGRLDRRPFVPAASEDHIPEAAEPPIVIVRSILLSPPVSPRRAPTDASGWSSR